MTPSAAECTVPGGYANNPRISQIVAVWKDKQGKIFVLSPCGRCREFVSQIHEENLETNIVLGRDHVVKLRELLLSASQFTPVELEQA